MLQHPECQVKGLRLPDNSYITNQMFADDTLLLLEGSPENMDTTLAVINKFSAASGAKLNLHKSVGVWIAHTERTWRWGEEACMKWLQPGEVTKYLGYPFGLQITQEEKDNKMLSQVRKHLQRWAGNKLSLAGRIMIANHVIMSSIWYFASCMNFSNQALNLVRATVRNYIWSGKRATNTRARVKWATAMLPIVRGGVKILDPLWQTSALLVKLLIRGMSVGYEPWKALVRYRVQQTQQSRRGKWSSNSNWIMNDRQIAKQGSVMWQGIMRAWNSIQSGIEQQDPTTWAEIMRQPLYGNKLLTNELGIQWGTEPRSNMIWWPGKGLRTLKDTANGEGRGWKAFQDLQGFRRTKVAPNLYNRLINSIPWEATPRPPITTGQWLAEIEGDGNIHQVYHIIQTDPVEAVLYRKEKSEQLTKVDTQHQIPEWAREVRIVRTMGPKNTILDYNPSKDITAEHTLWMWGNTWIKPLEWDRRIGAGGELDYFRTPRS